MTAWAAAAGSASVWLLVIVLATGAGYGAVLAWGRWGGRLSVPDPVGRALTVALGPPSAAALRRGGTPPAPVAPPADPPAPPQQDDEAEAQTAPVQATPVATTATAAVPPASSSAEAAEEDPADAGPPQAAAPDPVAAEAGKEAARAAQRPRRDRSRADALTELSAVLRIEYDAAAALLEHGLWGFENFDEWTRSMRGRPRPDDVPEEAWTAATQANWRDLEAQVEAHRVKQAALDDLEVLWGVGPEEAEALFAAGYKDVASIRKASTDAIAKVPGIGPAKAFQIRAAAHGLAPTP